MKNTMTLGAAVVAGLFLAGCDDTDHSASGGTVSPAQDSAVLPYLAIVEEPQDGIPTMFCVVGDFNGDGRSDLIIGRSTVDPSGPAAVGSLYLAEADHKLPADPNTVLSLPAASMDGVAADFDQDGKLDLAVSVFTCEGGGHIRLLRGNGDGTFRAAEIAVVGFDAMFLGSGDFNGDGAPDLAVTGSDETRVYPNLGAGAFGMPAVLPFHSYFAAGDVDGDGRDELSVIEGMWDSSVKIYGDLFGTPQVVATLAMPSGHMATSVVAADMDQDGDADVLAGSVNETWTAGTARVFFSAAGLFSSWADAQVGAPVFKVAAVDYNGDGRKDLAWYASGEGSSVGFAIATGDGRYEPTSWAVAAESVSALAAQDDGGCACGGLYSASYDRTLEIHGGTQIDQVPSFKSR